MPTLPTGTVTFLFTDIEGSTKLWEYYPAAMPTSLAQHDAILRKVIASYEGYVFKTIGDAFCAAFSTARAALLAAIEIQNSLAKATWHETGPLRVRMALHTGTTEERDNDYFGATVNRVARLLAVGHGGQVLLSLATEELVRDHLPLDITLRDMGERRLKDLIRPEHIFQVIAPSLPHDFPPLKTLDNLPNNLPLQLTSFVGREREINDVRQLLFEGTRLVTLFGTGGAGKTRLSLQVAAELLNGYEDGVWFVELAPLTGGTLVAGAIAAALDVREVAGRTLLNVVLDYLRSKNLLLVLDNCEHLVEDAARVADVILRSCPKVQILASSREALGVPGEVTWRIPSLSLPSRQEETVPIAIETLNQYEAVRLFVERAVAVDPTFQVTNENAPAVAQICYRLDGIPLALELAAARVKVLTVAQIAERLDDRFRLLTGGSRTLLPRQQTLRALVEWSYNLLTPTEQKLWQRLAIFNGSWSLEAAEGVCADDEIESFEVLDLLTQLVNKSLVLAEESNITRHLNNTPVVRYRMLETIRQFGLEKLKQAGELEKIQQALLDYFVNYGESVSTKLRSKEQLSIFLKVSLDFENIRTAINYALATSQIVSAAKLNTGLWWYYWVLRGNMSESWNWTELLLTQREGLSLSLQAKLLIRAGLAVWRMGNFERGLTFVAEAAQLARQSGDLDLLVTILGTQANIVRSTTNVDIAEVAATAQEAHDLALKLGDKWLIAQTYNYLGYVKSIVGEPQEALLLLEKALHLYRENGDIMGIPALLGDMAFLYYAQEEYVHAAQYFEEALQQYDKIFAKYGDSPHLVSSLGLVRMLQGNYGEARNLFELSIKNRHRANDNWGIAHVNLVLAHTEQLEGNFSKAHEYITQAESFFANVPGKDGLPSLYASQGNLALAEGNLAQAETFFKKSLQVSHSLGHKGFLALAGLANTAWQLNQPERAARLAAVSRYLLKTFPLETNNRVLVRQQLAAIPENDLSVSLEEIVAAELEALAEA